MTEAKAELLARNREVLAQMEKLRADLKQTQDARQSRPAPVAPQGGARAGVPCTLRQSSRS